MIENVGVSMTYNEAIEKAKEHFGKVVAE